MKERPILFSGPMVRAILDGRKTMTRRVVKYGPGISGIDTADGPPWPGYMDECGDWQRANCPYGKRGDRLWVRETWQPGPEDSVWYKATDDAPGGCYARLWKPSIHMPRWASRITLEITGVRVERLQDISGDDCEAEGIELYADGIESTMVAKFRELWESINGEGSWDANPWVWVVEFKQVANVEGGK